jgi:uncharacterized protein
MDDGHTRLIRYLKELGSALVAFSGGTDSALLLRCAVDVLGEGVKAVTIVTPYMLSDEIEEAASLAREMGARHEALHLPVMEGMRYNPENRCYICKRAIFSALKEIAAARGYAHVLDGTNTDDMGQYRPGLKALSELKVRSPLRDCGLSKGDVRNLSRELGLSTWNRPSNACLLSRIPYGAELREEDFRKIELAEKRLKELGFRQVRVRCHGPLASIELGKDEMHRLADEKLRQHISAKIKEAGFRLITVDLRGYRSGSMDEEITSGEMETEKSRSAENLQ